jgi:hypothetical protein
LSQIYKNCAEIIALLPEVDLELRGTARQVEGYARANLAAHRDSRAAHRIEVVKGRIDYLITLSGPAPEAIEFGHANNASRTAGLRILRNAIGSM